MSSKELPFFDYSGLEEIRKSSTFQEWQEIKKQFKEGELEFESCFDQYRDIYSGQIPYAWLPDRDTLSASNLYRLCQISGRSTFEQLHRWSIAHRYDYWQAALKLLSIEFPESFGKVMDEKQDAENPKWLFGSLYNIAHNCFRAPANQTAIIQQDENGELKRITYHELHQKVRQVAFNYQRIGLKKGSRIVLYLPLCVESVALYLGAVYAGMTVVSVADSFSAQELQKRSDIADSELLVTCDAYRYGGKDLEIYEKAKEIDINQTVVLELLGGRTLKKGHMRYDSFMDAGHADPVDQEPDAITNILFSSGTTKEPKAIPWTQLTPIKSAADGYFHHDIQPADIVTWTTGMGWMMAPWLIYASLLNKATMALYLGAHGTTEFCRFTEEAGITMLGTIPSIVKAWNTKGVKTGDYAWKVRVFSSTGEPSNAEGYFYLMSLMNFDAPVIEYCGGTEIGGGYITGSLMQPASPAIFTTPALGVDFVLQTEEGDFVEGEGEGEVFLVPPSLGLSESLLNRDHHQEYYADTPKGPNGEKLRRHGDGFEKVKQDGFTFYRSKGRTDDSMNIGGIKISAVEIEEVLEKHHDVKECAATSNEDGQHGPGELVVFVVPASEGLNPDELKSGFKKMIAQELNPLFRISAVKLIDALPRTASNKVMRRKLKSS